MPSVLRLVGGVCGFVVLAGCLPGGMSLGITPEYANAGGDAPLCAPGVYAGIVGEPLSAAAGVPEPKRIVGPGDAVTMDYDATRTNVEVNGSGVITRVFCG